jgi:predicted CXXCH cytochrome family protein
MMPFGRNNLLRLMMTGFVLVGWAIFGARAPVEAAVAKPNTVTEGCATDDCHGSITDRKVMHGPAAQRKCLSCHEYDEPREHRFKLATPVDELCADCHTMQHRTVIHAPVKDGNCVGCHDPHGSDHRTMLVADPTRGLCLSCHQEETFTKKKFVHGPAAGGTCILCHEPHSGWQPKLLVDSPQALCVSCHSEVLPKKDQDRYVHAPVLENCGDCHDAHASDYKFQLKQTSPDLCITCHESVGAEIAAAPVAHGAMTAEGGCSSCHSPHFSQLPKLQKMTQPESCLSCHDRPMESAQGQPLSNISALLKDNPVHHGPIRDGECTACHQPHSGERFRLLTAAYPPDFYAPFKIDQYDLCFTCHMPELVLEEKGAGLTRFRQENVNLHWLHVNQQKGRTCRACHEVHASNNPFHIRDAVPFGDKGWMLEINFEQNETGGSCAPGCHDTKTYDHGGDPRPGGRQEADHVRASQ